jgi:cyanophycinase
MKIKLSFLFITLSIIVASPVRAQEPPTKLLMPIGGGYSDIYAGFSETVVTRAIKNTVKILVLPIPYATNPESISEAERAENTRAAEERRFQIEEACKRAAPPGVTCFATLAPIFVHADAEIAAISKYFPPDLTAVFILGGDQTIAMQVIINTPVEQALAKAYVRGVVIAGTSAGGGLQSFTMLGGYNPNYSASNSLNFGAVDVWNTAQKHGLPFGIQDAIIDQHFYQRGRVGRLLNAISLPNSPHVGIGVDAYTGVHAPNGERLEQVFGLYTVTILDAETYHSANAAQYHGPAYTLSLRNVLVHLLSPGDFYYDIKNRQHSLGAAPSRIERDFSSINLPKGAGPLILGGNLSESVDSHLSLTRFVNYCGGEKANIVIIASGYPTDSSAQHDADQYKEALKAPAQTLVVSINATQPLELPERITGILVIGKDQSKIKANLLSPIKDAWLSGIPLMTDSASTAVVGEFFSAHEPTPEDVEEAEAATQESFLLGNTKVAPGLGLLNITVEPGILGNNRWGRLFSLAYNHPDLLSFGLNEGTALEITSHGTLVVGDSVVFVLDLRSANLDLGTNQGYVIANGLLDVFAPGDLVFPLTADQDAAPIHAPTPVLPTLTATQTNTPTPTLTATPTPTLSPSPQATSKEPKVPSTKTPRPTITPPIAPSPANPRLNSLIIILGILIAFVIFIGVLINRKRI